VSLVCGTTERTSLSSADKMCAPVFVMKRIRDVVLQVSCLLALAAVVNSQTPRDQTIKASEAKDHVGERAEVCGTVASTRESKYGVADRGRPTYLYFGKPYPSQVFTAVTWASGASKVPEPEVDYQGKLVCVTGKIINAGGAPEIITSESSQIRIQSGGKK
jgi:hypothetical protein